jgi:hypothetical protein
LDAYSGKIDGRHREDEPNSVARINPGLEPMRSGEGQDLCPSGRPVRMARPIEKSRPKLGQPELVTHGKGDARRRLPLAGNVTPGRLAALASTVNSEIGTAETEIRAFQPAIPGQATLPQIPASNLRRYQAAAAIHSFQTSSGKSRYLISIQAITCGSKTYLTYETLCSIAASIRLQVEIASRRKRKLGN